MALSFSIGRLELDSVMPAAFLIERTCPLPPALFISSAYILVSSASDVARPMYLEATTRSTSSSMMERVVDMMLALQLSRRACTVRSSSGLSDGCLPRDLSSRPLRKVPTSRFRPEKDMLYPTTFFCLSSYQVFIETLVGRPMHRAASLARYFSLSSLPIAHFRAANTADIADK